MFPALLGTSKGLCRGQLRHVLTLPSSAFLCATSAGNHIRLMLPTLRRQINEALEAKSAELAEYGPPLDLGSEGAR
jgi:hypothetical protein